MLGRRRHLGRTLNVPATRRRWQDAANVALGSWLIVSPLVFAGGAYDLTARVVGVLIVVCAASALRWPASALAEWACLASGIAVVVAPPLLGYAVNGPAAWNSYLIGLLSVLLAGWALDRLRRGH